MAALDARFHTAKEEVDAELAVFAGDLVEALDPSSGIDPYTQERVEDLLILARECAFMDPQEFRRQCEAIVQELDDKRQELPMGVLKRLHTRMLFILTRCTRLLQFEKENGLDEYELHKLQEEAQVGSPMESWSSLARWKEKGKALFKPFSNVKLKKSSPSSKSSVQEEATTARVKGAGEEATTSGTSSFSDVTEEVKEPTLPIPGGSPASPVHSLVADQVSNWKTFSVTPVNELESLEVANDGTVSSKKSQRSSQSDGERDTCTSLKETPRMPSSKRHQRVSWGHWGDQPEILDDNLDVICRICEDEVATSRLEDHSRVCALADRCDQQGLGVDERLRRVAETLERMVESITPRSYGMAAGGSPETAKTSTSNNGGSSSDGGLSERCSSYSAFTEKVGGELLRRGSEEMLEDLHEIDAASIGEEPRNFNAITCKTRFGPRLEQSVLPSSSTGSAIAPASSAGSLTPRSPLATPRISQIDVLLSDRNSFNDVDDPVQVCAHSFIYL